MLEPERVVAFSLSGIVAKTVLDVGTGTGLLAEAFAGAGLDVTGVDTNPELLAAARLHVPSGRFVEGVAEALPFADKSFDLAFLALVLHEVDSPLLALREAARTARMRVVVVEWPYRAEESGPPLEHRLSPERIEELAGAAGLVTEARESLSRIDLWAFAPPHSAL